MGLLDRHGAADALLDLLDRERDAALSGRFDVLERLADEKTRLGATLLRAGAPADSLQALRKAGQRNAALLEAMGNGVRRAQRRLAEARTPRVFSTYGPDGARVTPDDRATSLARRA